MDLGSQPLILQAAIVTDLQSLISDIKEAQKSDQLHMYSLMNGGTTEDLRWTRGEDGILYYERQLFVPNTDDLWLQVLKANHDYVLAGHPGQFKTYHLVRQEFNWPNLREFISDYVWSCNICRRNKARHHKPYGLLKQLPIPPRPWESISMDFIEQLPPSGGYTDILVVVDRLTKQVLFIPTIRSLNATMLAELFIKHVFSKYGVPSHITSNRGTEFISKFFRSLANALDMRLHFTSGYHPEADGQTEHTNQTLKQFLRIYCNYQQLDWSPLLPLAEFVYNNTPSSTTGVSLFYANKGYHPKMQLQVENNAQITEADLFVTDLRLVHDDLKRAIEDTQHHYQIPADKRRTPVPKIEVGDHMFILARFIKSTRPTRKLSEKYLGPFEVIGKPGTHSYLIKLPNHLRTIHPVFYVSQIEPAPLSNIPNCVNPPPPLIEIDGNLEFEVVHILDSKLDRQRRDPLLYLVQWSGYEDTPDEYSWTPASNLENAAELVSEFHSLYPGKPGPCTRL